MRHRLMFVRLGLLIALVSATSLFAKAGSPSLTMAGTISGRVTSSVNGQPILNTVIQLYEESQGDFVAQTTVDASGDYSFNVPPGKYGVITQNTQGYVNEIYNNVQCSAVCDVNAITQLTVTTNSFSNIDFVLDPGGRVAGNVTDAATGLPIPNVVVYLVDSGASLAFTQGVTDSNGNFISEGGTVTGSVYAATANLAGYRNEAFDNVYCHECDPTVAGASLIAVTNGVTTGGVNFALDLGGRVSGTIRDVNGLPLGNIHVDIFDSTFTITEEGVTDALGHYTSGGLPAGTYFALTFNQASYVDQAYNGVVCPGSFCNAPVAATPISVTLGGNTANVDFTLAAGGKFSGAVTNAVGGAPVPLNAGNNGIAIYNSTGLQLFSMQTDDGGLYTTPSLPPGTYYAQTVNVSGFGNHLYNGIPCSGCSVTTGTPIVVTAGNTVPNINFALPASGTITGTVTNAAGGAAIVGTLVQVFSSVGTGVGNANTNGSGVYSLSGLAAGSYYVRTNQGGVFMNEIYNDILCQNCAVTSSGATLVPVTAGATTSNINFALTSANRISGTITNATGGAAIPGVGVQIFNSLGASLGTFNTNASGFYITAGLPAGTYYVRTQNGLGFINKLYNDLPCAFASCAPTSGSPLTVAGVPVTAINFSLSSGGRISGTVTSVGGAPLQNVTIQTFNTLNRSMGTATTDAAGNYSTSALPDGTYFLRTSNTQGYIEELYDNIACNVSCSPSGATPITITGGVNQTGKNFALAGGGIITGIVRDAGTTNPLQGVAVTVYGSNGQLVKTAATIVNGAFVVSGLPAGTYYVRTSNSLGYKDKIFNNLPFCAPSCLVTDGAPVVVAAANTTENINFDLVAGTEFVQNGNFSNGIANWQLFATDGATGLQDNTQLVWQIVNGTLQYYRRLTSGSGVFLQNTGGAVASGEGVLAQFDFANTSDVRKRISVLIHDSDFSDLAVCTFWAPANSGNRRYGMLTHSTEAWTNATISLYAASADTNGGSYQIDNVTLQTVPALTQRTDCVDPHRPAIVTGADGPELLSNGDFATGNTNGWTTFGSLTSQVAGETFEFLRPSGVGPAGVILQSVGAGTIGQIYGAGFDLGNSSNVRKRVTVLLHDVDFSDLTACTYWLEPNTPLARYAIQGYATRAWGNATVSIYAASVGAEQWTRLDNVSFKKTPGVITAGTECFEPGSVPLNLTASSMSLSPSVSTTTFTPAGAAAGAGRAKASPQGATVIELESGGVFVMPIEAIDLTQTPSGSLHLESVGGSRASRARVEISIDGHPWQPLSELPPSDDWLALDVDLSPYAGHVVRVRVVFDTTAEGPDPSPVIWQIRSIRMPPLG